MMDLKFGLLRFFKFGIWLVFHPDGWNGFHRNRGFIATGNSLVNLSFVLPAGSNRMREIRLMIKTNAIKDQCDDQAD